MKIGSWLEVSWFVPYVGDEQANVSPTAAARLHFLPSFLHACPQPTPSDLPPVSCIVPSPQEHSDLDGEQCVYSAIKLSRAVDGNEESLNSNREG